MDRELEFGGNRWTPDVRHLNDMRDVLYDQDFANTAPDMELYYMYRDLYREPDHLTRIMRNRLRYDITVIPPAMLGDEYVKTAGHYHPAIPGTDLSYTEIYEVLEGTAHYLLQKERDGRVVDVLWLECKPGDKIVIPPNYGHITINPSPGRELKMANWVNRDFKSQYGDIREHMGAAYFELVGGDWTPNPNYRNPPPLRTITPTNYADWGLEKKDMYGLIKDPEKLAYLTRPQDYDQLFARVLEDAD